MVGIIEKVKQGIDKGFTVMTVKSKEMLEVARKKNQLNVLKNQKRYALFELGDLVFQMYLQNGFNEEKLRAKCEVVALLGSQVQKKENELRELHLRAEEALGKTFCNSCESVLPPDAVYCSRCGERIEVGKQVLH